MSYLDIAGRESAIKKLQGYGEIPVNYQS